MGFKTTCLNVGGNQDQGQQQSGKREEGMGKGDGVGGERDPRSEVSWGLGRRMDTAIYDEHEQVVINSIPRDNGTWRYVFSPGYSV